MDIELRIGAIVLNGFPAADYHSVGVTLKTELVRLITERGLPARLDTGWNAHTVQIQRFELANGAGPDQLGTGIALAIYEHLHEG